MRDDATARHALLLQAALAEFGTGAVASHVSAAVMHGLPTWGLALDRAYVTFDRRPAARSRLGCAARPQSVGESRSRVAIVARAGLPAPVLQLPVRLALDIAYSDFGWPKHRTVVEFDGIKYGRLLRPGQEPGDAVYAEKLSEDAIRAQDWEVVRWTCTDLRDFTDTAARIRDRFRE